MNSIFIGIVCLIVTAVFTLAGARLDQYFQYHSLFLVGFGTVSVLFLTFPMVAIKNMIISTRDLFKKDHELSFFESSIQKLTQNRFSKIELINPMINYAQQLWEQGVSPDLFIVLLSEKRNELEAKNVDVIHSLKNLAKYPPALGMVGTVMGMIDLFMTLDKNQEHIGEALSVAMTATLLGLLISNLLISPLADRLHVKHMKEQRLNTTIYELMLLINGNQPLSLIQEEIKNRAG